MTAAPPGIGGRRMVVSPGDRHLVSFSRTAVGQGRSINYVSGDAVRLHVVVRASVPELVVNDCPSGQWGEELHLALASPGPPTPFRLQIAFGEDFAEISLPDGRSARFTRWRAAPEPLDIHLPGGVLLAPQLDDPFGEPATVIGDAEEVRQPPPSRPPAEPPAVQVQPAGFDAHAWLHDAARKSRVAVIGGVLPAGDDMAGTALRGGATAVTVIDLPPPGHEAWRSLDAVGASAEARGRLYLLSASLAEDSFAEQLSIGAPGGHDIVVCRGMLARLPDPLGALIRLREITLRLCLLSIPVVPDRVEMPAGPVDLDALGAVFAPAAAPALRGTLATAAGLADATGEQWVVGGDPDLGRGWWFITRRFAAELATLAGFVVLERHDEPGGRLHTLLLAPG